MIAAICGATGLIGSHLLPLLCQSNEYDQVLVIGRSEPKFKHSKIIFKQCSIDQFNDLQLPTINHAFCCLGTTIKVAGSKENFIKVDTDAIVAFAKKCQADKTLVVSSVGADSKANAFYSRVKGVTEDQLAQLKLPQLFLFRPSLLLGNREQFRFLETLGQRLFSLLSGLFVGPLLTYKPINASQVAANMHSTAQKEYPAVIRLVINNKAMLG